MNANELRIGNWVTTFEDETPIQITPRKFEVGVCRYGAQDFNPIPLTPEILEKAGFERYAPMMYRLKNGWHWITVDVNSAYINGKQLILLEHLHQLQNLIFALTGEELEIKL